MVLVYKIIDYFPRHSLFLSTADKLSTIKFSMNKNVTSLFYGYICAYCLGLRLTDHGLAKEFKVELKQAIFDLSKYFYFFPYGDSV